MPRLAGTAVPRDRTSVSFRQACVHLARRSGRGPARWCAGCPWLYPPFPASCPFRACHHSVSGPRHIEPDRRISRIRLAAKASSTGFMIPFGWCALLRSRTRGGSPRRDPTAHTRLRYSTGRGEDLPLDALTMTVGRREMRFVCGVVASTGGAQPRRLSLRHQRAGIRSNRSPGTISPLRFSLQTLDGTGPSAR